MPTQALIRNLNKQQVAAEITKANAQDLLEVVDDESGLLVCCRVEDGINVQGSPKALQALADIDAKITNERASAAKAADEKAKADEKARLAAEEAKKAATQP